MKEDLREDINRDFAFKDQVGRPIRGLVFWHETDVLTEIFHQRSKWVSSVKVQRNFWSFSFGLLICVSPQYYKHPRLLWDTESKKKGFIFFFFESKVWKRLEIKYFFSTWHTCPIPPSVENFSLPALYPPQYKSFSSLPYSPLCRKVFATYISIKLTLYTDSFTIWNLFMAP